MIKRRRNPKNKGLQYRCSKCDSLYAYAKRCEDCGIKTVLVGDPKNEKEVNNESNDN